MINVKECVVCEIFLYFNGGARNEVRQPLDYIMHYRINAVPISH
jgi:hypothetical protein